MKQFAINSLVVNIAFDLEEVRLRCCLFILIRTIILMIKMKILGVYILILKKHSTVFHTTDYFLTNGVLQVCILGPILLSILIKDMPERVLSSLCYLFAADLKLLSISSSINFQNDIDNVYQWSVENGLIIHPDKTNLFATCHTSTFLTV